MKTLTEFSGVVLRRAASVREERTGAGETGDAVTEAVGAEVGMSGDRLARLLEALDAVGKDVAQIRLVRVYQGETAPPGAITTGGFHYVVDRIAPARAPGGNRAGDRGDRGGRRRGEGGADGKRRGGRSRPGDRGSPPRAGDRGGPSRAGDRSGPSGPTNRSGPSGPTNNRGGPSGRTNRGDGRPPRGAGPGRGDRMPVSGEGWSFSRAPREAPGPGDRPRRPRRPRRPPRESNAPAQRPPREPGAPGQRPRNAAPADAAAPPPSDPRKKRRRRRSPRNTQGAADAPGALGPGLSALVTTPLEPAAPRKRRRPKQAKPERAPVRIEENGEVNGNVALPPPPPLPDDVGNR